MRKMNIPLVVAVVFGLVWGGATIAHADPTPHIPVNASGSCSPGWYVNDDGDENTRKPVQTEDGLKFSGNQLAHHTPVPATIYVRNLHPGTFVATPAPSLSSFFSVEILNPDNTGYATLRYDTADDKWNIGGTSTKETNPLDLIGKQTRNGTTIQYDAKVVSFGIGYVANPATGTETTVKSVTFAGRAYDMTCKPAPSVPSVLTAKAKCRVSKTDKRELWTISNVSGGRDRQFWAWVWSPNPHPGQRGDGWYHLPNGHGSYTVKAGKSLDITSGWGGTLSVKYYDGKGNLKALRATSNHKVTCH